MTELTREEVEARWRKNREEELVRQAEKEKATKPLFIKMCKILLEKGVHFVEAGYDGQGDSGCIEEVDYLDEKGEHSPPGKCLLPGWKTFGGQELDLETGIRKRQEVDGTVEDFIEDFVYGHLSKQRPGWEINDGSFGTFQIDLKDKSWDGSRHMVRTYIEEEGFGMSGSYED